MLNARTVLILAMVFVSCDAAMATTEPLSCSALFQTGQNRLVVTQLARLRVQAELESQNANKSLAKALYQEFQLRFQEARKLSLPLGAFETELAAQRELLLAEQAGSRGQRARRRERENRELNLWNYGGAARLPVGARGGFLTKDGENFFYLSGREIYSHDLVSGKSQLIASLSNTVYAVAANSDQSIAAASMIEAGERMVIRIELPSGKILGASPGRGPTFSPDGSKLALLQTQGGIKIIDAHSGNEIETIDTRRSAEHMNAVHFSEDGNSIVVASTVHAQTDPDLSTIFVYKLGAANRPVGISLNFGHVMASSPSGLMAIVVLAASGPQIQILNQDFSFRGTPIVKSVGQIASLAFGSQDSTLIARRPNGEIVVWDLESHQPLPPLENASVKTVKRPSSLSLSGDGLTLAIWNDLSETEPIHVQFLSQGR